MDADPLVQWNLWIKVVHENVTNAIHI